uniref:Exocyst complex component 2 n=1 Tax=Paramormyrops kingsleyae TaxID=1676925 RepID=A0A3B3S722_9TELE
MSRGRQPPLVTGISPNEGIPWTKVTIRGENLGTGPADLIGLSICGHNCLLTAQWMSASKIVCRVGPAKDDKGEIIVTTKSGGPGTSTVSFKLLKTEKIGILDQSAVWVDEMNYYDMRTDKNKSISPLSLRPANPLGIDTDKVKVAQMDLESMFPSMSGDFTSENFSATWYLIENHSTTSFEQLRVAANNLRKQANKKNEGSLAYVKGGLSTFFEAQDALSAIHQKLEVDGTEKVEGSMTQRLEKILNRASDTADTLFQEVLGRKDKADSTRNALNVLQRFKFLFNLPLNIERNIQKGDYDVVINDYEKAKSLFGNTEVQVFRKVYAEVETRIGSLRALLLDKLLETPSTLHDQKRYIRYLSDLHASGDPAWQCIVAQHHWILQLMQTCKESFIQRLKGGADGMTLDSDGELRPSGIGRLGHSASFKSGSTKCEYHRPSNVYKGPQQVSFVEKLADVVTGQLPNFWKLWISYVNGSLFSETGEKSGQVEKLKKNARQRQSDFKKMIEEVTHRLVKLVRGALLPSSLTPTELQLYGGWEAQSKLSGPSLTQIIHTVRGSHEALAALEIPNDLLQVIQELLSDLRVHCLMVTLKQVAEGEGTGRQGRSLFWGEGGVQGRERGPARFEQHMVQMLQSLKGPMDCKPGEVNVRLSPCRFEVQSGAVICPGQIAWAPTALHVSGIPEPPPPRSIVCQTWLTPPFLPRLPQEQRLLLILSNCHYLEKHTFLNLAEHFERHGFLGTEKITRVRGGFRWRDPSTNGLYGVRNYLKEALVNIITVHAEVFTVSKELVPRVVSRIVEAVAEEMSRLMQCVSSFSRNGALQVSYGCSISNASFCPSSASFKQALEALPQLHNGADKK